MQTNVSQRGTLAGSQQLNVNRGSSYSTSTSSEAVSSHLSEMVGWLFRARDTLYRRELNESFLRAEVMD